ncbi:hypothetical protein ACHAWF_008346 [Thalassiosira exigua]
MLLNLNPAQNPSRLDGINPHVVPCGLYVKCGVGLHRSAVWMWLHRVRPGAARTSSGFISFSARKGGKDNVGDNVGDDTSGLQEALGAAD